ncbi:MAG: hypothetical protein HOH52_04030 [Halieaceae bacterium]|jgi:hypothetical protein|nr:hypothetical protein [Halieaceae bacterium]MBT5888929.1 hypothetical protein [Halieaceae bacterium]
MTRSVVSLLLALSLLTGCVTETVKSTSVPVLDAPETPVPDAELLDVGVVILDPGISSVEDEEQVYPEVRRAEATFMATELADVLTEQGGWGAVRVVPDERQFSDLLVRGTILQSDGEALELKIRVSDARGTVWLDKRYTGITSRYAYEQGTRTKQDPFLSVYRMIANDMLAAFQRLPADERTTIRRVAEMRFARDFASGAFADYLNEDPSGQVTLRRLPSEEDPMLARVRGLRQRHYVFVDTLQGHYTGFSDDMYTPYQEWRKASYEETVALRELESEAKREMIAGGAAILAGIVAQSSGSSMTRSAGAIGVVGGGALLKRGLEKRAESNIHSLALEELGQSLDAEITPRVIELEDRTVRLTGNVEDQYDQWRELLADIYAAELAALEPPQPEPHSPSLLPDTQDP